MIGHRNTSLKRSYYNLLSHYLINQASYCKSFYDRGLLTVFRDRPPKGYNKDILILT